MTSVCGNLVRMIVTRFAPSPTGYLHLGHAFAAITAHDTARRSGGGFLLRIEDIDSSRCRAEFERAIYDDLVWLGLKWGEPAVRQSERFDAYRLALQQLQSQALLYPCFCTRSEIAAEIARASEAPHGPEGPIYPGTCRNLKPSEREHRMQSGASYALRLDVNQAVALAGPLHFEEQGSGPDGEMGMIGADPRLFGDVVLARKDTPASYHLCVTFDDALQGVTLVTRGEDLKPATHLHRLLQALMGWPTPIYAHHRLLTDAAGRRLAKRDRAASLRDLRAQGHSAAEVRALAGHAD